MNSNEIFPLVPAGWRSTTLGELAKESGGSIQTGPFGSQLHAADYVDEGIPSIMPKNIRIDGVDTSDIARVSPEDVERLAKHKVLAGDVVYSRRGDVEKCCLITSGEEGWLCGTGCLRVRIPSSVLSPVFLHAYLCHPAVREWIVRHAIGATMPNLNTSILSALPILVPPIDEAESVADIWALVSRKISLNTQTNQALEQMAQALFKSWFVDFDPVFDNALDSGFFEREFAGEGIPEPLAKRVAIRQALREAAAADTDASAIGRLPPETRALFPDSFEEHPELGWIPKGWGVESLESMTSEIIDHRGKTPKKLGGDWSLSGYPAISAKNIKGGRIVQPDTIRFVDEDLYKKWMKVPLEKGDLVVTSEAPLGEVYYLSGKHDYLLSQRLYGMRANPEICTGSFLYFWLQTGFAKADIEGRATGTTVVGIRQVELRKVKVLAPNKCIVDLFDKQASLLLEKIEQNQESIYTLSNLRDTLLPKLLSGELTLPEVEVEQDSI
ncbi:restriction endonuclease subunit S [Shewanella algae]|uniref:restriction endonuclease subunit S n=1 Tax=Shewanella algae TaxID=38313 RepID=UPI001AAD80B6|nr:restriction endonuclease subunit S [Shewanella algae]MBO2569369.1 restriction endonuclease subunit S [Shewanella algae]